MKKMKQNITDTRLNVYDAVTETTRKKQAEQNK